MPKKKKFKKVNRGNIQAEKGKSRKTLVISAFIAIVGIAVFAGVLQQRGISKKESSSVSASDNQSMRKGETRETLSPSLFADPFVASMYQAARDIPNVFDSVKCYCYCETEPFRHKSLLSCFVDRHAESWRICLNEARRVSTLYQKGTNIKEISDIIDKEFGR